MLPLNQKQITQYRWMRFGYLAVSMLIVPPALYYCRISGMQPVLCCTAAILCLMLLLFLKDYTFPADMKGSISTTLGLAMNFLFVFLFTNEGTLFSFYYLFFSFLCFQSVMGIGLAILIFMRKKTSIAFLHNKILSGRYYWLVGFVILILLSPLIASPYFLGKPFMRMMNSLEGSDFWFMWLGLVFDIGQQIWIVKKIAFAKGYEKEINDQQNRLMKNLEPGSKAVFIVAIIGIGIVLFL
jgi:hypothetical protein